MLRFHTQTAGVQLTAQQPEVNLVRVAVQALAAVLGGTQSLHTNSFDEAIALPTEKAARLALRTQQVLAYETDLTATVDPFAGSYAVESLTDEVEAAIRELMAAVEELRRSGRRDRARLPEARDRAVGVPDRPGDRQRRADGGRASTGSRVDEEEPYEPLRVDPAIEAQQAERLATAARGARQRRGRPGTSTSCARPRPTGTDNVLLPDAGGAARPGPPSARSATRCATCGASTSPPTPSDVRPEGRAR